MSESKKPSVSKSGEPIYRHVEPSDWQLPQGKQSIGEIQKHIGVHLGKVETVFHEIMSDTVHIDVHRVEPTDEIPYFRLITSGMSDLPMSVPPEVDSPKYIEW